LNRDKVGISQEFPILSSARFWKKKKKDLGRREMSHVTPGSPRKSGMDKEPIEVIFEEHKAVRPPNYLGPPSNAQLGPPSNTQLKETKGMAKNWRGYISKDNPSKSLGDPKVHIEKSTQRRRGKKEKNPQKNSLFICEKSKKEGDGNV